MTTLLNKCLTFVLELFGFILENFLDISDPNIWDIFTGKKLDTFFRKSRSLRVLSHGSKLI